MGVRGGRDVITVTVGVLAAGWASAACTPRRSGPDSGAAAPELGRAADGRAQQGGAPRVDASGIDADARKTEADAGGTDANAAAAFPLGPAPPSWHAHPFDDLPTPPRFARKVAVHFDVAPRTHAGETSTPLLLRVPSARLEREIYDDRASTPSCRPQIDAGRNALWLTCAGIDGSVELRAYQVGAELVVDVGGGGDVLPTLRGATRVALPPRTQIEFHVRVPTTSSPRRLPVGPSGP